MMTTNDKNNLKLHANRNITIILEKLNVKHQERGTLIQAACPCDHHGGDRNNRFAFSWRTDIGYWICWTHHCEEKFGNDIFGLIRSILNCDFKAAVTWLENITSSQDNILVLPSKRNISKNEIRIHAPLDETRLRFLKQAPKYLLDRGFSADLLKKYEIGAWNRIGSYMHDRVVIPIRDHDGHLIGFTGRTIHDQQWHHDRGLEYKKWLHGRYYDRLPKEDDTLSLGSVLFNMNNAQTYLLPHRRMILVEGPLDGLRLQMYGIYNWVASLGTGFTSGHRSLLIKYGVSDLYVAYDNDINNAGEKGWERLQRIVGELFRLHRVQLPLGRDPGSLNEKETRDLFLPVSQAQC